MITIIAAMGLNRAIGENNKLLWDLPRDMSYFKEKTKNKIIVMGRKTFDSIGYPLPNRKNIVLTKNKNFIFDGIFIYNSVEDILNLTKDNDLMVIGGSEIYKLFLPFANNILLTLVDSNFPNADSFFPKFINFSLKKEIFYGKDNNNKYDMTFKEYVKND
jgi:dihydrofolate reductase